MPNERPLYAVLIDADNIPAKYAGPILKEITALGEPALRRVYGDWSSGRLSNWSKVDWPCPMACTRRATRK